MVTWSKGKGHLTVSGVHHVFVPLSEVVGYSLQQRVDLGGYGKLRDNNRYWVRVLRQLASAGQLHHLLKGVQRVQRLWVIEALD